MRAGGGDVIYAACLAAPDSGSRLHVRGVWISGGPHSGVRSRGLGVGLGVAFECSYDESALVYVKVCFGCCI